MIIQGVYTKYVCIEQRTVFPFYNFTVARDHYIGYVTERDKSIPLTCLKVPMCCATTPIALRWP